MLLLVLPDVALRDHLGAIEHRPRADHAPVGVAEHVLQRRLDGAFEIDPWGLDVDLLDLLASELKLIAVVDLEGRPTEMQNASIWRGSHRYLSGGRQIAVLGLRHLIGSREGRDLKLYGMLGADTSGDAGATWALKANGHTLAAMPRLS